MKHSRRITPHFYEHEFACKCCGQVGDKKQLMILATKLEQLRSKFNKPIRVISGYRCQNHNDKVDGAKRSQHLLSQAADIMIEGFTSARIAKMAHGIFNGIGLYDTFTHVDTRQKRTTWDKRTKKEVKDASDERKPESSPEEQLSEGSGAVESSPKPSRSKKRSSKKVEK